MMIYSTLHDGFRPGGCNGEMCAYSLLENFNCKIARSSIEEYLIIMNINRLEKVDRQQIKFRDLVNLFKDIKLKSFSGKAIVQVESEPDRVFLFSAGSLVWVNGGVDPLTRWQRS
jgi:hypothetical protein